MAKFHLTVRGAEKCSRGLFGKCRLEEEMEKYPNIKVEHYPDYVSALEAFHRFRDAENRKRGGYVAPAIPQTPWRPAQPNA